MCTTADDGDAAWTVQSEGTCNGSGGVDDSVCDYLQQTQCMDRDQCSNTLNGQCGALVKNTFGTCKLSCAETSSKTGGRKCADCFIQSLFESNTVNLQQPDIFSCCGCLVSNFGQAGVKKATLESLLALPCQKHSATGDDDDQDDDDH